MYNVVKVEPWSRGIVYRMHVVLRGRPGEQDDKGATKPQVNVSRGYRRKRQEQEEGQGPRGALPL